MTGPLARFLHLEAASGVVLLACTAIALAFANSPLAGQYQAIWDQTLTISLGSFELAYPLWYWINDALMAWRCSGSLSRAVSSMPIFALANAGVAFEGDSLAHPLSLAVAGALVLGKPVGIVFPIFLLVRTGLARLPGGVTWAMILGAGSLAGIGFTMALFVASLGLTGQALLVAKGGVLLGSAISLMVGFAWLVFALSRGQGERDPASSPAGPRSGTG